jgi:hypothetical protein
VMVHELSFHEEVRSEHSSKGVKDLVRGGQGYFC